MAKDYLIPALEKLHDFFTEAVDDIEYRFEDADDGDPVNAKETKKQIITLIDRNIKELNELKSLAKKSMTQFITYEREVS